MIKKIKKYATTNTLVTILRLDSIEHLKRMGLKSFFNAVNEAPIMAFSTTSSAVTLTKKDEFEKRR